MLFARRALAMTTANAPPLGRFRIYGQGVVTEILNPKTALFFLSFLPQFVDPRLGEAALQMLILGCILVVTALAADLCIAFSGGTISKWAVAHPIMQKLQNGLAGAALIAIGVRLAVSERG